MELSQKLMPDGWLIEMFFNTYMYGAGIAFLAHCYLFQIHPGWFNSLMGMAQRRNWIKSSSVNFNLNNLFIQLFRVDTSNPQIIMRKATALYI
jgi:hypothetical protein